MNNSSLTNATEEDSEEYIEFLNQRNLMIKICLETYTVLSLICVALNILFIYVTIRYRRLRYDKANIILLNWAILNTFFMIFQPISARISLSWFTLTLSNRTMFCILEETEFTALFGCVLMIMLLLIYWYFKLYHPRRCVKFSHHIKLYIGIIYIICLFLLGLHLGKCFDKRAFFFLVGEVSMVLVYLIFIVFMIIMNIIHFIKRRKLISTTVVSNIPLLLANAYFASIFPILIVIIIEIIFWIHNVTEIAIMCTALILAVMNPIYFFIILYKRDKDYRTFYTYVLNCQCNKYGNDEMEEDPVAFNGDSMHYNL